MIESSSTRLQQRLTLLEKQLEETKQSLSEERQQNQVLVQRGDLGHMFQNIFMKRDGGVAKGEGLKRQYEVGGGVQSFQGMLSGFFLSRMKNHASLCDGKCFLGCLWQKYNHWLPICVWFQASVQTMAQHMELMRKVETVNLLRESNKLLREENTKMQSLQQEMDAKVRCTQLCVCVCVCVCEPAQEQQASERGKHQNAVHMSNKLLSEENTKMQCT